MSNLTISTTLQLWNISSLVSSSYFHSLLVSWVSPPYGVVKVNFDASWNEETAEMGFIIRD